MRWITPLFCLALGCTGSIGDSGATPGVDDPSGPSGPTPPGQVDLASCSEDASLTPTSRIPRLSHVQFANTVRDLLALDERPSEPLTFVGDVGDGGFDNNGARLNVSPALGRDYQRLAEQLATAVSADRAAIARFTPCDTFDDACADQVVGSLGLRAYRRPLTADEHAQLRALFDAGPTLVASGDNFADGIHVLVEGLLQSPSFLYRVERTPSADAPAALNGWEIATRLSYALWGTMPDDELFEAARTGELEGVDQVRAQADRMLSHPSAEAMIADFHKQLLHIEYGGIARDIALNPAWSDDLAGDLEEETHRFVRRVILEDRGSLADLFTAPFTFANDRTAAIYGEDIVSDPGGEGFRRVELNPARRAGLLTQLGFLASNAYFNETDPIHRGVFLHRQILCSTLPDPPDDVSITLPEPSAELRTTRERVEHATSESTCRSCHLLINEPGFAFESFDPIGQWRTEEDGVPVDTTGELPVDGDMIPFDNAVELSNVIADTRAAAECYTRHLFRYAHARLETGGDCDALADMSDELRYESLSIRDLLIELVTTPAFLNRLDER